MAYNDAMASGAMTALQDHNIAVPNSVSVIGFDDVLLAKYCRPKLTTLRYPIEMMAMRAAELALSYFGADLALACDLRVLSERAYLQEKFVGIGLMPDGGATFHLPRLVGVGRALELLLLGEKIEAARALELGLANRVVPPDALHTTALELCRRLADGPPLALSRIKLATRNALASTLDEALAREGKGQAELLRSADLAEGVGAWAMRRKANFQGR
jgi:1,4-dihydroxy-2-naphthoyl-CoA synthase